MTDKNAFLIKEKIKKKFPRGYGSLRKLIDIFNTIRRPPHLEAKKKLGLIQKYAREYNAGLFVESGTYRGDMVEAVRDIFSRLVSIELDDALYENARLRFKDCNDVEILHGDSGRLMSQVVRKLEAPALFWLDAHYSGKGTAKGEKDTPILAELSPILESPLRHIILIDDARLFNGMNDYPTMRQLEEYVGKKKPGMRIATENGVIVVAPK